MTPFFVGFVHIFDFVSKSPYPSRYNFIINSFLKEVGQEDSFKSYCLMPVIHEEAFNYDKVDDFNSDFIECGYEGSMIRWGLHEYKNGRTKYLLKYKKFQDIEAEVIDILPGRGKRANTVGKWVLRMENGKEFEASPTGKDEENSKIYLDKSNFIGKIATIKFQDYTPAGVPRFPTFKGIRDYE
jgi:DNA ligase-1